MGEDELKRFAKGGWNTTIKTHQNTQQTTSSMSNKKINVRLFNTSNPHIQPPNTISTNHLQPLIPNFSGCISKVLNSFTSHPKSSTDSFARCPKRNATPLTGQAEQRFVAPVGGIGGSSTGTWWEYWRTYWVFKVRQFYLSNWNTFPNSKFVKKIQDSLKLVFILWNITA